ncbi:MAG: dipicolinate synthase subunit DpsA [Eubacteriales bacterium]|nr:dipicolinate synthase subunit DpsA [Eubacteriales bacterium]
MRSILIAGGDKRQVVLSKLLKQKGFDVSIAGFDKLGIKDAQPQGADYVFLPIPYRNADGYLKAPYASGKLALGDIVHTYPKSDYVLGMCDDAAKKIFGGQIQYIDLLQNEAFLVKNAQLTAEAAICVYQKNTETALCHAACVVIGYGRISRFLCKLLKAYSADVTATARKDGDLALIWAENMRAVHTGEVLKALTGADVVFNTVPAHVLNEPELKCIKKGAKIIELASSPYGMDMELAKKLGVCVQIESGLPGRYFPASAANAILYAFEREEL